MSDVRPVDRPLICFVDDEPSILASLSAAIRSRGDFDVSTFDRAAAFLAFGLAASTRCLVTDHKMPGMDGRHLIAEVRRRGWSFPVIVNSGFSEASIRPRFAGLNIAAFVEKSTGSAVLMTTILKLVQPLV